MHYQMLKMLKEHYGATVEKAVLWGKEDQVPQTSVYMRKADGTVVELTVKLADALVLATLGEAPFYIRTEMLENRVLPRSLYRTCRRRCCADCRCFTWRRR